MESNLVAMKAGQIVDVLKAVAEPTRLRVVLLLADSEFSVKDLTRVLGQSQPRISRHLKLLHEAGVIERSREGSWVYFTLANDTDIARFARDLIARIDAADGSIVRDRERAETLKAERETAAQAYFAAHAAEWDRIRALHVDENVVEAAMRRALSGRKLDLLVDLGTGTGRILELFADRYSRGLGIDANHAMLAYARSRLSQQGHVNAQVRQGDIYNLALADESAGAVVMHQVLHFLSDPARAIREAARVLEPGGELLIVDFAPHECEFLREKYAHDRLGFASNAIESWVREAGLDPVGVQELSPPASDVAAQLTVSLWVARRRGGPERKQTKPVGAGILANAEQSNEPER